MSHYDRGREFEWKVRDDLADSGYEIIRAAGSKGSHKVDLAAFKPGQLLFVQCKRDGNLPPAEWDRVVEVSAWVGAVPLLAANGVRGHGVTYLRLLAPKVRYARTQPCAVWRPDELASSSGPRASVGLEQVKPIPAPTPEVWAAAGGAL